ncbi:MAG: phage head-tail connector protein [Rhizobiaceae bacterium]|nr:phage head-tail connector protein [Rhizobiaceae bacterium]
MRSLVTVTTPAGSTKLTTLDRVKAELDIAGGSKDAILNFKIAEASSDIEAYLGYSVKRETVSERFWQSLEAGWSEPEFLILDRTPVGTVTSVTVDDVEIDAAEYRLDPETGQLYRLDASGYPSRWCIGKEAVVVYAGGYLLPGQTGRNLPPAIEAAAVDLVQDFWFAKGRDPSAMEEDIPGVMRVRRWIGAVGVAGDLPPSVQTKLYPFRRASA